MRPFNANQIRFFTALLVFLFSVTLSGCKKEDPNPELLDPIFTDLTKRATEAQKSLEDENKKMAEARIAIGKYEPNTIELKNGQRDLLKAEHTALDLEQKTQYYKIRAQRRLLVDQITYKEAFAKNQPWPDPHEYSDYLVNMRLQEAPRNWNSRVPKLQERLAKAAISTKKDAKKEGKSEE